MFLFLEFTWLTKVLAEMKSDSEQTMKLEWLYKVGAEWKLNSWPLKPQLVRASERNSVVVGLNPIQANFLSYFKESFSGEYHMYQFILLHSCDYIKKISIKINVVTDDSWNEIWHWTIDKIGVAIQSSHQVQVELMTW